jgi:uncharacterized membrane protein
MDDDVSKPMVDKPTNRRWTRTGSTLGALHTTIIVGCFSSLRKSRSYVLMPRPSMALADRSNCGQRSTSCRQWFPSRPCNKPSHLQFTQLSQIRMNSLVNPNDDLGNLAFLLIVACIAQPIGKRTKLGRLFGAPVTAMALSFFAASCGIICAGGTHAATTLQQLALNLATPLVLLGADFRRAMSECKPLLISFLAASLATLVGGLAGWFVAGPGLSLALGGSSATNDGLIIAAALIAKNIGGGLNYIAVCHTLNASPTAIAAGLCIDNIMALIYFPATSSLACAFPDLPQRDYVDADARYAIRNDAIDTSKSFETSTESKLARPSASTISVQSVTTSLALSLSLLWVGKWIVGSSAGALPACTVLTVFVANMCPESWIAPIRESSSTLGLGALYVFFATAGAPGSSVADAVRLSIKPLMSFLLILYSCHGAVLWLCHTLGSVAAKKSRCKVAELEGRKYHATSPQHTWSAPQRLLIASSAAIGGPATALALAQQAGWQSLELPGILVGNIGYAIATFIGLGFFRSQIL